MTNTFRSGMTRKTMPTRNEAQNQGAAFTHSNEGAFNQTNNTATSRRRRNIDDMQMLTGMAIRKFRSLPTIAQNTAMKLACIDTVLASHKDKCGDAARYYIWLLKRAAEVKRTFDFTMVCEQAGLKTETEQQAVAEHLVLEGKSVCNKVRMDGLATYEGNIRMFRDRLVPEQYHFEVPATEALTEPKKVIDND